MITGTQDAGTLFAAPLVWDYKWGSLYGGDSDHNLIDPSDSRIEYFTSYADIHRPEEQGFWRLIRPTPGTTPFPAQDIRPSQLASDSLCGFFPVFSMNPSAPTHLIAACQRVVRTTNATASPAPTWNTIGPGRLPADPSAIVTAAAEAPNNPNVIYAIVNGGTVYMTTNANQNDLARWQQPVQPPPTDAGIRAVTVDPNNYNTAYIAADKGVYKTTDGGKRWNLVGLANAICRDVAINPINGDLYAATTAGVFTSTDGGTNWSNISAVPGGIPQGLIISGLSFNVYSQQLAAATLRGVYLLTLF
jgi:hypothetical protein